MKLSAYILLILFSILIFFVLHILPIYGLDVSDKEKNDKLKLINLKGFKYFFVFGVRKEGKMSFVPFIYAMITYILLITMISLDTVYLFVGINTLSSISKGIFYGQFLMLIPYIIHIIKNKTL